LAHLAAAGVIFNFQFGMVSSNSDMPQEASPSSPSGLSAEARNDPRLRYGLFRNPAARPSAPCELTVDANAGLLEWKTIFGRACPVCVEIGCGGGRTLLGMALAHPERNFVGLEHTSEYFSILCERVTRRGLCNLRISRVDAALLLHYFIPDASVQEYHIYFPDPWPKKRHHKRRLFTEEFCADLRRTLISGGVLYLATDHAEYYTEILPRLRAVLAVTEHPGPWEDAPAGRTNYEVKYLREGRAIYRLRGVNCQASPH
jgi:tRNA (guanine-N7-)-methyltransferase